MLRGHLLATGILILFMEILLALANLKHSGTFFYFLGIPILAFLGVLIGLVSLPYGWACNRFMQKIGYTGWFDYLFAGLCFGVLLALLTQGILVDTAPKYNGYQEVYGWERASLFVRHYVRGAFLGLLYGACYRWTQAPAKL